MTLNNIIKASLIGLAFCVSGCGESNPSSMNDESVVLNTLGRYVWTEQDTQLAGWPGSGTEFAFQGRRATIDIKDDGRGLMDLAVNGDHRIIALKAGRHDYTLVDVEEASDFHIQLTRRTESYDTGYFELGIPQLDGEFTVYAPKSRKILFIGDSITAGFGVAGFTRSCANNPALNDPLQSYAMLAAEGLDAEPQLVAISGRGVVHNWDSNPAPVMPAQLGFALPDRPDTTWDHAQFKPDVVVTLLGTNDWSVIDPGRDRFRAGYRDMLSDIRERFPKAHVVTVSGPLLTGEKGAAIRDGIDWAMAELKDENISTLDLQLADFGYKWSCNSHPGQTSMKVMANDLMVHVNAELGWEYEAVDTTVKILPPDALPEDGKAHFNMRVAQIEELQPLEGGALFIGDSITEGWLASLERQALLPDQVANHGVGWDTADGIIRRLPQILKNESDRVFLKIGTNDIHRGRAVEDVVTDVVAILQTLREEQSEAEIFLQSVLPRETELLPDIARLNARFAELAVRHAGVEFLDLTPYFAAEDGTLKPDLTYDGVHLNDAGYEVWAKALEPYFNR